jgi:hypothetical protein
MPASIVASQEIKFRANRSRIGKYKEKTLCLIYSTKVTPAHLVPCSGPSADVARLFNIQTDSARMQRMQVMQTC